MLDAPDRDSLLRSLVAGLEDREYEREVRSTETGRASALLRHRAVTLVARGRQEAAHELLLEAVRLHPETDLSAAAGSARHDLGHSFSNRRLGVRIENLLAAERYFRASLACPSRASRPLRAVQTQSSLGLCLRDLSAQCTEPARRAQLLNEAEALLRRASTTAEKIGPAGWALAAACLVNLGNLLRHHRDDVDAALTAYRRALDLHCRLEQESDHGKRSEHDLVALAAARAYLERGRKGDTQKAIDLASDVLAHGDAQNFDTARLVMAEAHLATKERQREEHALAQLRAINFSSLPAEKTHLAADLFRRLKQPKRALELLEWLIGQAIQERSEAMADHVADEAARRAHQAAAVTARLYVATQRPLDAFLALENCSALRFIETASVYTWQPSDPETRELLRELHWRANEAATLEQMAGMLERVPREERQQLLSNVATHPPPAGPAEPDPSEAYRLLGECAKDAEPVARLRREAAARVPVVSRLRQILTRRQPETSAAFGAIEDVLEPSNLGALLDELPGHVLIRISLVKDLLVVAVWKDGGKLAANAHRMSIPPDQWQLLRAALEPSEAPPHRALTAMLERLDLSPALPEGRRERAVVLPSGGAAFLPLGALGPPGRRLLDRFDSILWLPSLFPLRTRQDAHPPRERTLIVTPPGTKRSDVAIGQTAAGELRLVGERATRAQVLEHAATADVICFYTHGRHAKTQGPSIELADGSIGLPELTSPWSGIERVELWACETGVNIPADPLIPPDVDEPFGLDFSFLRVGVRSAIGTLWKVPELVTAAIIRRFRGNVAAGRDPAHALADAQRWWLAEGLPSLLELLASHPPADAFAAFAARLGGEAIPGDELGTLGQTSAPDAPLDPKELQRWREYLACPVSWAGFRFVGVPERRPLQRWTEEHARPIDESVKQKVRQLIESAPEERESLEEWRERELDELERGTPGSPTPEQAITAARLYRDRITSSHTHNLLAGLAWLHEALACEPLAAEARASLLIEAAHLWLDLATGEALHPVLGGPSVGARARARALLEGQGGDDPDLAAARARLAYLDAVAARPDLDEAARRAWQLLGSELGPPSPTHAAIRRATAACEWFVAATRAVAGAAARIVEHADELLRLLQESSPDGDLVGPAARLLEARNTVGRQLDPQREVSDHLDALTPRELARATYRQVRILAKMGPSATQPVLALLSEALGQLEGAIWGWPSDRMPLVASSGTTGRAYRDLLGRYVAGKAQQTPEAAHVIACLQYACDLRLAFRHNVMRLASAQPPLSELLYRMLWWPLRDRDALWTALADMVDLVRPEAGVPKPPVLDPFTRPARALQHETSAILDATGWVLGKLCESRAEDDAEARTAAYQAVRMAGNRTRAVQEIWDKILTAEQTFAKQQGSEAGQFGELLDPEIILEQNKALLRGIPDNQGILALSLDERYGLVGACLWRDRRGPGQRLRHIEDPALTKLVLDLVSPREQDNEPTQGRCAERQEAWTRLRQWLAPHLQALWGDALTTKLHWKVLAPGALRSLPLLGLYAGKKHIAAHVESLVHIPSLGFSKLPPPPSRAVRAACLLARAREDGDTSFGEAAIETLRRASPCEVLDPQTLRGRDIVEAEALEAVAEELASLRLYGVGAPESLNATTAGLQLEGRRTLGSHNLANLRLGRCDSVEIWACVAGGSEVLPLLRNDTDRLPGLVADLLGAGARGVLDLAWPIPDLVKAVVCEQLGFTRLGAEWGPAALRYATFATAGLLGDWADRARSMASVPEALALLDAARRWAAAEIHRADASCIVPFADRAEAPSLAGLTVPMLLEEMTHPSHLAAFRWWGL
ncbi:MAG TPA: CHAT domain-containing protein [Kofleriaceae bacterium]|nr:CHAT domain-containing protein [Kofleriaceae bacterium]